MTNQESSPTLGPTLAPTLGEAEALLKTIPEIAYQEPDPVLPAGALAAFERVVETRRSVRVFAADPVPEAVVRGALNAALASANSSNLQPWEFYWVRSPEAKSKLIEACLSQPAAATAPELIVAVARTKTWPRNRGLMVETLKAMAARNLRVPRSAWVYYQKLVPFMYRQGVVGIVRRIAFWCMGWWKPVMREPRGSAGMRVWAHRTTALACQSIMLYARAAGYDSCPMEGFDEHRVRRILKLPRDASVSMVISIGKRDPRGIYGPRMRFDSKLFLFER